MIKRKKRKKKALPSKNQNLSKIRKKIMELLLGSIKNSTLSKLIFNH